jgi:hypothetical protein
MGAKTDAEHHPRNHRCRVSGSISSNGLPPTTAYLVNHVMMEAAPPEGDECRRASLSPDDRRQAMSISPSG